eukprot:scaffold22680_cov107-Cylindrotheca_fusiformis.AAC.19
MSSNDMMRHWGRRYYDGSDRRRRYSEETESEKGQKEAFQLEPIEEEASQEIFSCSAKEEKDGIVHDLRYNESDDDEEEMLNRKKEDPKDEFQDVPLHASLAAYSDNSLMLTNSNNTGNGKYRTVSIFGGVFDMPDPSGDADSAASSTSSDFSSDDFSPPQPTRKSKRAPQNKNGTSPPRSQPKSIDPDTPPTPTSRGATDVSKAVKALDAVERQVNDLLQEFESNTCYPVVPMVFGQAVICFDGSKQCLESILMMEDLTLSC